LNSTSTSVCRPLILVVEDDPEIADILSAYLRQADFRVQIANNGEVALLYARRFAPDLMLLDLKLPKRDGFEVLAQLRVDSQLPVIVISALADDLDKLSALRIGADDYVTKPFNPKEVVARVQAVLRRSRTSAPGQSNTALGALSLDQRAHRASVKGQALDVTLSEYRLLAHLFTHTRRVYTRADLLDACLEDSDALERTVDSHISNLRRKLDAAQADVRIATVRGVGYRLERST